MRQLNDLTRIVGRMVCASLFAVFPSPSFGRAAGDTVSPVTVSLSAACGRATINISYRNNWADEGGATGIRSLMVNGRTVRSGVATVNAGIRNARIAGISFIRCERRRSEFLVLVRVDSGDVRQLGVAETQLFSINPNAATPAR